MIGPGKRVLVLGLGKVTGAAVARVLFDARAEVSAHDSFPSQTQRAQAEDLRRQGARVSLGEPDEALVTELVAWAELIVPSPGVPPSNPILARALDLGVPVASELELGFSLCRARVAAVTGTNGKTTTTALLAEILRSAGHDAQAVGNIGVPFVTAAAVAGPGTILVAEVSSFQLAFVDRFRPEAAVVLNVADDHYDWHSGYEDYLAAKARITENQLAGDRLAIRAGDPGCGRIAAGSQAELAGFGASEPAEIRRAIRDGSGRAAAVVAGVTGERLVLSRDGVDSAVTNLAHIRMQGPHNLENVLAAALAAERLGVSNDAVADAVARFENLPHRTQPVATKDGVSYIDDSKATNPHATLRALNGMERVVLVAGGRAKGLDLSVLGAVADRLSGVVVMGEAASELRRVFDGLPAEAASDVEEAVRLAAAMAIPGDTVLLSPACSSLDQYSSYSERGTRFQQAVAAL